MTDKLIVINDAQAAFPPEGLFANDFFEILTFESPLEALKALEENRDVAIVIYHMSIRQMDVAAFFEKISGLSPFTLKILLVDRAEINGDLYRDFGEKTFRIIPMPCNDYDLQASVRNAAELYRLRHDHANMRSLAKKRFRNLTALNSQLEEKAAKRAEIIRGLSHKLEKGFLQLIEIFQSVLKVFDPLAGAHAKRVTVISREIAGRMGLEPADIIQIELASLLHDIGKLSLPKYLVEKDVGKLNHEELAMVEKASVKGYNLLHSIERLKKVAVIVGARRENFDGSGSPDGLSGGDIPMGARIIRVANDYDDFTSRKNLSREEAFNMLKARSSAEYDPDVVSIFSDMLNSFHIPTEKEVVMPIDKLREGHVFSRNIALSRGKFLVRKDSVADRAKVDELNRLNSERVFTDKLFVHRFSLKKRSFTLPHHGKPSSEEAGR